MSLTCARRPIRNAFRCLLWLALLSLPLFAQAPPSADTFVSSATPKLNYGSSIIVAVGPGSNSYVQFNLSGIPAGANIGKATLRLYVDAVSGSGTLDVFQVTSTWTESKVTYNTRPTQQSVSAIVGSSVPITSASWNQFLLIDITPLAQGWMNGTIPNNGIALTLTSGSGIFSFDSKESFLTGNGPELEIAFTSGTGPQGPQGPAGPVGPQGPQGVAGAVGPTGATGSQGATGLQGAQGPLGPMGLTGAQGLQGVAGPQGTAGTGFNFRAAFDNTASYAANDVVSYNGSSYVAKVATNPGDPAPGSNSNWNLMSQQGASGSAGATGPTGASGPTGAQGPQGIPGLTGSTGAQGPQGTAGTGFNWRGAFDCSASYSAGDVISYQGSSWITNTPIGGCVQPPFSPWALLAQQGAAGPTLTSFNNLNGIPCSINGTTGAIVLSFSTSDGALTLTCNVPQFTAHSLGILNCGNTVSESGSLALGTSQWFVVTFNLGGGCPQLKLTLTTGSSIVFDVQNTALSNVVTGVSNASLTTAGTYYIRIYGTDPSVMGNWTLALTEL